MFAHFVGFAPQRVVAAILADPGHYDPVGVDKVELSTAAMKVPELIMVGGWDKISGTERPYQYFRRYGERGAPWIFLVQNKTPHCCIINAKSFVLRWLNEMITLRDPSPTKPLRELDQAQGWAGYIKSCSSDISDSWGGKTWNVCSASVQLSTKQPKPNDEMYAGWFPTRELANEWLTFIQAPAHNTSSLP
jgi:hypothetical protein